MGQDLPVFESPTFESAVQDALDFVASQPVHPLPPEQKFQGPGVYMIYYTGNFDPYQRLANANRGTLTNPIYAGKAVPKGWRKGREVKELSDKLHMRLREHARSIEAVENLTLDNFSCRFAIFTGEEIDMIGTVENALIRQRDPLWNQEIDGFGNHHPGQNRLDQTLAEWDTLHPGRSWEQDWRGDRPDRDRLVERVESHLSRTV
ncbi:Eco29kI family restriction endonuclease [Salinibacter ruber]|uniref:Eco29kI family restriction endonuclease n=1 Tax=Salinibacter ruber TaxID=146919 RepID=UPI002169BC2B|nr:Eco29kI family restriction endonuclease [Salinibacter ruber]MCS4051260.1 hypothetical protein [Salinibacter ruber]